MLPVRAARLAASRCRCGCDPAPSLRAPISPAHGPPTDWGELVQVPDDRNVFQATERLYCPRSISTASDPCRTPGPNKAVRWQDSERLRADAEKTSLQRVNHAFRETVLGPARWEHAAHESLISRPMLAEVPLAGRSSRLVLTARHD